MTVLKGAIKPAASMRVKTLNLSSGRLIELADIDPLDLNDGAVIVYNETSEKYRSVKSAYEILKLLNSEYKLCLKKTEEKEKKKNATCPFCQMKLKECKCKNPNNNTPSQHTPS